MVKKTLTYKDFNNNERTEEFYFNLTDLEGAELAMDFPVDVIEGRAGAFEALGYSGTLALVKNVVLKAYGVKGGDDGRSFIKSDKLTEAFSNTKAFSIIVMELFKDNGKSFDEFLMAALEARTEAPATATV